MTKTDLIAAMAERAKISRKDAENALHAFTEVATEALCKGDKVQLVGFGSFESVEKPERIGRNPKTGKEMLISASKHPRFKAGKTLKDAVTKSMQ